MAAERKISFETPAGNWREACLLGNGYMGQAVYGDLQEEKLHLSHLTFFSGSDLVNPYQDNAPAAFQKAREAALAEDYESVSYWTKQFMGKRGNYGTNLPVGILSIKSERKSCGQEEYVRSLDIMNGIFSCEGKNEMGMLRREAFSSYPDRVFAYLLEDTSKEGMQLTIRFDGGKNPFGVSCGENQLHFETQALESIHSDGTEGVKLFGTVKVCVQDGQVRAGEDALFIENAHLAVIYLAMETDFCLKKETYAGKPAIFADACANRTLAEYDQLKEKHVKDVSSLMNRQELSLPGDELTETMYQYGRYLLLSSSRENSPLPTPLQGVWNDGVACRIGWTCDMHLDINTQMNYWISEPGNLEECHKPLFRWMENRLIPLGRQTAEKCYGSKGWVGELVSNAWGYAAPYWSKNLSPCPTGGIWQASDYVEHYRYGQDKDFLRKHAFLVIEEAVEFFLDYLFWDNEGRLTSGPSISPENGFLVKGKAQFASLGCTYELLMIRELFLQYRELCKETGGGRFLDKVEKFLPELLPYRVLTDGTLAEWRHDYAASDLQHRHTSHLLGLFPYSQITPEDTPELAEAAAASIQAKLTPYENWEDTGWARSLLMLYNARLKKGEEAYRHLLEMQKCLTGSNLLVMHPPTRGTGTDTAVYELDGNTGFSMSVMEMLVQSHNGCIQLLPALPEKWEKGRLRGAVARGGITLDIEWNRDSLRAWAVAKMDKEVIFRFCNQEIQYHLEAGRRTEILFGKEEAGKDR